MRVFGDSMAMWRTSMPKGMSLKSEGFASSLYDPSGQFTLARYCAENGIPYADVGLPVTLDAFTHYGMTFQSRFVPHLENRIVTGLLRHTAGFELQFGDGDAVIARRVVVAVGVGYFAHMPEVLAHLPPDLASHSSHHHALDRFAGRDVAVIGAGASAIDIAALLRTAGANTHLIARVPKLAFQDPPASPERPRSLTHRMRWPRSGIGYGWKSYLAVGMPGAFRRMPESVRLRFVRSHLGPAPCWFTKDEIVGKVPTHLGVSVEQAKAVGHRVGLRLRGAGGTSRELQVDHVIAGTGFRTDLARLPFLPSSIHSDLRCVAGAPVLSANFESSISGLYFIGPVSASTFGPLSRFAFGASYAAKRLDRHLATAGG